MRWALIFGWGALCALSGCTDEFSGDAQALRFSSDLGRGYRGFDPRRDAVAVGSTVHLRAVGTADGGRVQGGIAATVSVTGDPIFSSWDAGAGALVAIVSDGGRATLTWDAGGVEDQFSVFAAPAAALTVDDPLRGVAEPLTEGTLWPAAGGDLLVAPGRSLALEAFATASDGGPMVYGADLLSLDVTAVGRADGRTVIFDLPDAGLPRTLVGLRLGGALLGQVTVTSAPLSDVARVELAARDVGDTLALKATAYLDGGRVLWAAPVDWAFDPRLERVDAGLDRADVVALRGRAVQGATIQDTVFVEARIGPAKARLLLLATVPAQFDAGLPFREAPPGWAACGCSTGDGSLVALALLLLGVTSARRPRRRRDSPADPSAL